MLEDEVARRVADRTCARRGDASALEDEVVQKVWSAQCGDTSAASACHDEVVKRVAARGSTPQDSALEDNSS